MKVKNLEWVETLARTPVGDYEIVNMSNGGMVLWIADTERLGSFPTVEAAKLYAQYDFKLRVMGCIDFGIDSPHEALAQ